MKKLIKTMCAAAVLALMGSMAAAKLPVPELSDEAKAKAAEAAAKSAWAGKVDAFALCKAQDRAVTHYKKTPAAIDANPAVKVASVAAPATPCADPGPFVYSPAGVAPAAAAAPAASAAVAAKKP